VSELEQQLFDRLTEVLADWPQATPEKLAPLVKRILPFLIETGIILQVDRRGPVPILTYYKPTT